MNSQNRLVHNLLATVGDMVSDLMYYDRKEDEDLPVGTIEELIQDGQITVEEIVSVFSKELNKAIHGPA